MAQGTSFILDAVFSDGLSIPADPRLNAGSLLLLEPARDAPVVVPSTLRNYAADQFQAVSGQRVDTVEVTDALTGQPGCLAQLTAKKGLHGIVGTGPLAAATRTRLAGTTPAALINYLIANPAHKYYMGMIGRVTRNDAVPDYPLLALGGVSPATDYAGTSNVGFGVAQSRDGGAISGQPGTASAFFLGRRVDSNVQYFADVAVSGHNITSAAALSQGRGEIFTMGERVNTANIAGWPSHILYTLWIEDLTISGRTYAQCSEQGLTLYNRRFGVGGEYAGDTWTNPATVS